MRLEKQRIELEKERQEIEEYEKSKQIQRERSLSRNSKIFNSTQMISQVSFGGSPIREKRLLEYIEESKVDLVFKPKVNPKSSRMIEKKRTSSPYKYSKELNAIINDPQRNKNIYDRFQENQDLKHIVNSMLTEKVLRQEATFTPHINSRR